MLTSAGAVAGALLALTFGREGMRPLLGVVLVLALPLTFFDPGRLQSDRPRHPAIRNLGLVAAGVYGGLVQAGVGVLLLAVLSGLGGWALPRANAAKLLLVGVFTAPALALFVAADLVAWIPGLSLAVGAMLGAFLGSLLNMRVGAGLIRIAVAAVVVASGYQLLFQG